MKSSLGATIFFLSTLLFSATACTKPGAGSGNIAPDILNQPHNLSAQTDRPNHYLWGYFTGYFDPSANKAEFVPARDATGHWNVLTFLEKGPCLNCVIVTEIVPSPNGTFLFDVELRHPVDTLDWTGFDVRGICLFNGTHKFTSSGLSVSDNSKGEGELVNADGFTTLYNGETIGKGHGGIEGYQKGIMASATTPTAKLNGYKRYNSPEPGNVRNAFYGGATSTRTYNIALPNEPLVIGYAVDACWMPGVKQPVQDPMIDFPPNANCPEPWNVVVTDAPIGQGLTNQGGQTKLKIKVYDRQGKDSHTPPSIECPELWNGLVTGTWVSNGMDPDDYSYYEVIVGNPKYAAAGTYKCLVSVEDEENATSPPWLDLTAYQVHDLAVGVAGKQKHQLWYFTQPDLRGDADLAEEIQTMQQAAAAGYTKVVVSDFRLGAIDLQSQGYWSHLQTFAEAAADVGVEVIPALVNIGYSDSVMCHDANLIEGQPVQDCLFSVNGNIADVMQSSATTFINGNFENYSENSFLGWNQMDGPGIETFADTSVKHTGNCSIRFENFTNNPSGDNRIRQDVIVKPWQCYAISFWLKTEDVEPASEIRLKVFNQDVTDSLEFLMLDIAKTQDWTQYYVIFNSQEYIAAAIFIGLWGGKSGRFWVDDVTIENTGLINLIRRNGTPLTVTSEDGSVTYEEGVDFEYVSDPLLGLAGSYMGTFDLYHERPVIKLTAGSKINNGDHISVDYYHATFVYYMQSACCLSENAVYDTFISTLSKVNELIHPTEVFINVDELRVANWCDLCQSTGKTPGQLLADATQRIEQIAHSINPQWNLIVWSDMYDPYHNAVGKYYLANGTLAGSWGGLPASWDIANWHNRDPNTLSFFEDHGNRQILCGFYDDSGPDYSIDDWLDMSSQHQGVYAAMYTTWHQDFSKLAEWAVVVKDWDAAD